MAERPKSALYGAALALLNRPGIELLDNPRLVAQILGLERRTARGGRDSIDHGPGAHDDLANVALGLAATMAEDRPSGCTWGDDGPPAYTIVRDGGRLSNF